MLILFKAQAVLYIFNLICYDEEKIKLQQITVLLLFFRQAGRTTRCIFWITLI